MATSRTRPPTPPAGSRTGLPKSSVSATVSIMLRIRRGERRIHKVVRPIDNLRRDRQTSQFTQRQAQDCFRITNSSKPRPSYLKMAGKRVSYTLDSTLESVNTMEQIADKFAIDSGFNEEERHKISLA